MGSSQSSTIASHPDSHPLINESHGQEDEDVVMRDLGIELPPEIFEILNRPEMDPPVVAAAPACGHIYLIREREFIELGWHVYKIGKTAQQDLKRAGQYPKGSVLKMHLQMPEYHTAERELIAEFKLQFIHRPEYGAEYFEGDLHQMMDMIYACHVRRRIAMVSPCDQKIEDSERKSDNSVFVLECAFQNLWQHMRHIASDQYYAAEMQGVFLEHMIFLITGPPGGLNGDSALPVSPDRSAPVVNIDKFRTVLSKMYTPGPKKNITCDQFRRYVGIYNFVTSAHLLVIQYESARMATTRPNRYPEIKMTAALVIGQETIDTLAKKCVDYKHINVADVADKISGRRRQRTG